MRKGRGSMTLGYEGGVQECGCRGGVRRCQEEDREGRRRAGWGRALRWGGGGSGEEWIGG